MLDIVILFGYGTLLWQVNRVYQHVQIQLLNLDREIRWE